MVNETLDKKIAALQKELPAVSLVGMEYAKAKAKHPVFPANPAEGLSIIAEELGELAEAINDQQSKERMKEEAAHVAVTAIRFIEGLEK